MSSMLALSKVHRWPLPQRLQKFKSSRIYEVPNRNFFILMTSSGSKQRDYMFIDSFYTKLWVFVHSSFSNKQEINFMQTT